MKRFLIMTFVVIVAMTLGLSYISVKDADADAILFPWVTKSDAVSTVISVVNTAAENSATFDPQLHYEYWYKLTTANDQEEKCKDVSFKAPTTKDDLVVFDASGNMNNGEPLFGDPTNYGGQRFDLVGIASPRRAFLIVDNNTPAFAASETNVDGTLYGEAALIEIAGGAAWGYIAYNSQDGVASSQNEPVYFDDQKDVLGEVIGDPETTQTTLMPPDTILTRFFFTPVDDAGQRVGNANTRVQLCANPDQAGDCDQGGVFDDNEAVIDFEKKKDIVCTSADDLEDLMNEGAFTRFQSTGGAGWTYIVTHAGNHDNDGDGEADNPEDDIIMGKLEFTTAGVTMDGTSVPGTLNTFRWLRDDETRSGCPGAGIDCIHNEVPQVPPQ